MDVNKQAELIQSVHEKRLRLFGAKRSDYATEDVLSNFKRMCNMCHILNINPSRSSEDAALFLILLKMDRYCNLRGREAANESVEDTVMDWHNYIDLCYACRTETDEFNRDVIGRAKERLEKGLDKA